jgi:CHAT domain-containing protein
VSSYTPTLAALLRAQEGQRTFPADQIKLLAIAAEYAHNSSGPRLQHVPREVQAILDAVQDAGASGRSDAGETTTAGVVEMIKSANMVHFACHGNQHRSEPHKSHFCLTTGNLSVTELMEVDLENAFFAFLSACETAKGDTDHADEVVHLAATMLFAGFKSVVATMWSVSRHTR